MTPVYLVTLAVDLTGVRASAVAATLFAEDAVVTIRIADAGAPSVVRLDIDAATEHQATCAARELVTRVGRHLGCALEIRSAQAVQDSQRGITGPGHDQM